MNLKDYMQTNMNKLTLIIAALWLFAACGNTPDSPPSPPPTGPEYGAHSNPTGDEIAGGDCYSKRPQEVNYLVSDKQGLLDALGMANEGEIVALDHGSTIDLTGEANIQIPDGVTLSGTRGDCSTSLPDAKIIASDIPGGRALFRIGNNARATGLIIVGPDPDNDNTQTDYQPSWNKAIEARSSGAEIDNCEISNFNHAGISINSVSDSTYIHHNYIHDIHYYPILLVDKAGFVIAEANRIEWVWEAIASQGHPHSGYTARYNIFVRMDNPPNRPGYNAGHAIDVHPHRETRDKRSIRIGGNHVNVHHNTFTLDDPTIDVGDMDDAHIRGVPRRLGEFHHNVFVNTDTRRAVRHVRGNVWVYDNVHGPDSTLIEIAPETTPQVLFVNPPPAAIDMPTLTGTISIYIEVNVLDDLELEDVSILLDEQHIYTGSAAPSGLEIDLCEYSNGRHVLTVKATDNRGVVGTHRTDFKVNCE